MVGFCFWDFFAPWDATGWVFCSSATAACPVATILNSLAPCQLYHKTNTPAPSEAIFSMFYSCAIGRWVGSVCAGTACCTSAAIFCSNWPSSIYSCNLSISHLRCIPRLLTGTIAFSALVHTMFHISGTGYWCGLCFGATCSTFWCLPIVPIPAASQPPLNQCPMLKASLNGYATCCIAQTSL